VHIKHSFIVLNVKSYEWQTKVAHVKELNLFHRNSNQSDYTLSVLWRNKIIWQ